MAVPCGKCPQCTQRRIAGWCFRMMKEAEVSTSALFVTLTYDTDNVPITKNGLMTLDYNDLKAFYKKLRKYYSHKIKYFNAGEYGGKKKRPHYHAIIYNADYDGILKSWKKGSVYFGTLTPASATYVMKYIDKCYLHTKTHERDDRKPEFQTMSKGLGLSYINEATIGFHRSNLLEHFYLPFEADKKIALPRYYKNKIYTPEQLGYLKGHFERKSLTDIVQFEEKLKNQSLTEVYRQRHEAVKDLFLKSKIKHEQRIAKADQWDT